MIKFFRKIRYNLMEKGKTGRYFKYAIGEVILVVIGILIALSINNWNENRKDAQLEKYYLIRLISDLEADITEIDTTFKYASEYIVIGNNILKKLGQNYESDLSKSTNKEAVKFTMDALNNYKINITTKNFGSSLGKLFDERIVDMNNFTYSELVSTGNFEVIDNKKLRQNLTNYYLSFSAVLDIQDNLLASIDEYNKMLQKNHIPIINSLTFNDLEVQLNTEIGKELQTSIKNLIYNHAYSISPFRYNYRPKCINLIKEIKKYLEQL